MKTVSFYFHDKLSNLLAVWNNFKSALKDFKESGGAEVVLKPYKKNKTDQQRRYAHMCIGIIANENGERPEVLKVRIKHSIGLCEKIYSNGEIITIERSTEDLTRNEYSKFIGSIKELGAILEIQLPEPSFYGMEI